MPSLWNNDEAIAFFNQNGYPTEYNDGLLQWLRDTYDLPYATSLGGSTLPDLLKRYINEFGDDFTMRTISKSGTEVRLVEPAATFVSTTPSSAAGGADTLLTSAGVHGLTGAVAVGASIFISAGTGWTVGFHTITAIAVDTTGVTIQIDTPFSAGFGTPTISLANTEVVLATVTVPPLNANSQLEVDAKFFVTNSGNIKRLRVKLGTDTFYDPAITTQAAIRGSIPIANRNSVSSQIGGIGTANVVGYGNTTAEAATGTTNTAVESSLTITGQPAVANEIISLVWHRVILWM